MTENQIEYDYKNEQLKKLKLQIEDMIKNGEGDEIIDEQLFGISLTELNKYVEEEMVIEIDSPRIRSSVTNDQETFYMLCDYLNITIGDGYIPKNSKQNIYFIESADNALVLIPIQLIDGNISYRLEFLANAPDFITEIYANLEEMKINKKIKDLKSYRVRFDKFGNKI